LKIDGEICERFVEENGLRGSRTERRAGRGEMGVRVQALAEYVEDRRDELRCDEAVGRDERFEEMVARQARFMFQVAFGLLRNRQDAEDAVQEAFLKLYRGEAWLRMENEKGFLARTVWAGSAGPSAEDGEDVGCCGDGVGGEWGVSRAERGGWG
jgi:Sigma-70 region 2